MSELWQQTASEIVALIKHRKVSAVEVTKSALGRLDQVNPAINAVVTEMPEEAINAAKLVDEAIARGDDTGILSGVPVTVKVNVDQVGHATTNGLKQQRDLIATIDSPVVSNLRKSGAIIVGRTNTPAFSLRWFTRNSLHGNTVNPHNPEITPGGSSGGAAAAVASGICAIGHGTDIGGSIRYPAYACGIHGLRPGLGRVPAMNFTGPDRHVGGQLMAVSGPLARSIADTRIAFEAMAAEDLRDPWWTPVPVNLPLNKKCAALCVNPDGLEVVPEVEQALRDAARKLEGAGWQVVETECPTFSKPAELQATLWLAEMRRYPQVIATENDPDANFVYRQMDALCPEAHLNDLLDTIQIRATLVREWQLFLDDYPVLICPVSAELPFSDHLDVESPAAFQRVIEAQLTQVGLPLLGLPGLTVNTGILGSTPIGIQLVAGRFHENALLLAGEAIEQAGDCPQVVDPAL